MTPSGLSDYGRFIEVDMCRYCVVCGIWRVGLRRGEATRCRVCRWRSECGCVGPIRGSPLVRRPDEEGKEALVSALCAGAGVARPVPRWTRLNSIDELANLRSTAPRRKGVDASRDGVLTNMSR
jgi:hypothetical protein